MSSLLMISVSAQKYEGYIDGWEDDSSIGTGVPLEYSMSLVYIEGRGNVLKINKTSGVGDQAIASVKQVIDPNLLVVGHTYRMDCDRFAQSANLTWVCERFGTDWGDKDDPYINQINQVWISGGREKTITDLSTPLYVELQCQSDAVTYYVDNVRVYDKADPDKTNLLINGDFETGSSDCTLNDMKSVNMGDGTVDFVWDSPSEKITGITVKNGVTGATLQILDRTATKYTAQIASADTTYSYLFIATNIYGSDTEIMRHVTLKQMPVLVTKPTASYSYGKVTVSSTMKNNVNVDGANAVLFGIVYKNGVLLSVRSVSRLLEETSETDATEQFQIVWTMPSQAGTYTVKTFVWDSLHGLLPLSGTSAIKINKK